MQPEKKGVLWINVAGDVAVLGRYVYGLLSHPGGGEALQDGAPREARSPLYTVGMLLMASGY